MHLFQALPFWTKFTIYGKHKIRFSRMDINSNGYQIVMLEMYHFH